MNEEAVQLGEAGTLVGIVTSPQEKESKPAVVLLNPGIVHRVGPGRIYVRIARTLAARGFTVLRFDFSGIGDSTVRRDNCCFEKSSVDETRVAMNFLQATRGVSRFILLGGCSGATVSLATARLDRRVIGAVLINFPARTDEEEEPANHRRDLHYYRNFALLNLKSWRKLLTGQSDYRKIGRSLVQGVKRKLVGHSKVSDRDQHFREALWELAGSAVHMTFICAKEDLLLQDLYEAGGNDLRQLCAQGKAACEVIPKSDHTFSSLDDQKRLVATITRRVEAAALVSKRHFLTPETASRHLQTLA